MVSSAPACVVCGAHLVWAPTGRPRFYCGATCRSRARRARLASDVVDQLLADVDQVAGLVDQVPVDLGLFAVYRPLVD
jgi:hypothetical protein